MIFKTPFYLQYLGYEGTPRKVRPMCRNRLVHKDFLSAFSKQLSSHFSGARCWPGFYLFFFFYISYFRFGFLFFILFPDQLHFLCPGYFLMFWTSNYVCEYRLHLGYSQVLLTMKTSSWTKMSIFPFSGTKKVSATQEELFF